MTTAAEQAAVAAIVLRGEVESLRSAVTTADQVAVRATLDAEAHRDGAIKKAQEVLDVARRKAEEALASAITAIQKAPVLRREELLVAEGVLHKALETMEQEHGINMGWVNAPSASGGGRIRL